MFVRVCETGKELSQPLYKAIHHGSYKEYRLRGSTSHPLLALEVKTMFVKRKTGKQSFLEFFFCFLFFLFTINMSIFSLLYKAPKGSWQNGFFDHGSFMEIMQPWAQSVVVGRARYFLLETWIF